MFRMSMGSKSQKQNRTPFGGISRVMSPINAGPCGTPGNPPCDEEYKTGSETYKGEKDGVKGTYTKTSFQTDFEIPGKPGTTKPPKKVPFSKDPKERAKQKQWIKDNREEYEIRIKGKKTPGTPKTYGEKKRSDVKFVPDPVIPEIPKTPPPKKEKKLPSIKVSGKGRKSMKIGKPSLSMGPRTRSGGSKRGGNSCGCAVNN